MTYKLNEIARVHGELGATRAALTELREQMDVLAARAHAYERQLDELQGARRAIAAPLTDRIVALVGELGEVGPGRVGDVLSAEDPTVNKASVRAMLGQLVVAGRLVKPGRGRYAVAPG